MTEDQRYFRMTTENLMKELSPFLRRKKTISSGLMVRFGVVTECAHRSKDALNDVGEEKLEEELTRKVNCNPCCVFAGLVSSLFLMKTL